VRKETRKVLYVVEYHARLSWCQFSWSRGRNCRVLCGRMYRYAISSELLSSSHPDIESSQSTDCRGVFEMEILRVNFVHFFSLVYTGKVSVLTVNQFRSFKHFLQIFQNLELPMQNSHCDHRNFDRVNQTLDPNRSGCEKWYVVIWSYIYIQHSTILPFYVF
jgi:hypothetical protein